jgi:hypothetical protein
MRRQPMSLSIKIKNDRGGVIVIVGIMMTVLIAFAALAIDLSHLFVVKNELQNAADAGALAGARFLYSSDGTMVNAGANEIAKNAAVANESEGIAVEVNYESGNSGDAQRGRWSFATGNFRASSSLEATDLVGVSAADLDDEDLFPDFINAVRVITRRDETEAASFLARIFGYENFIMSAEAVAYIGFAGTLGPGEADQPIVVCREAVIDEDDNYSCSVGTMSPTTTDTAAWTDFNQEDVTGGTNTPEILDRICSGGNPEPVQMNKDITTTNGEVVPANSALIDCWNGSQDSGGADSDGDGVADQPWNLTLPLIDCSEGPITTYEEVVGTVNLNILWITDNGNDPQYNEIPSHIGDWDASVDCAAFDLGSLEGRISCWDDFVTHFNILNPDETPGTYASTTIYFKPDCEASEPSGLADGPAFGVMAKIPVLVK